MLDATRLDSYRRDGYAILDRLLGATALMDLRQRIADRIAALRPGERSENMASLHYDDPWFRDLFLSRTLVDVAAQILGDDIALFTSYAISKPAGDGKPVAWHQDAAFFPIAPMATFTLWLAVDDSTRANGCMQVLPGSHVARRVLSHETDRSGEGVLALRLPGAAPQAPVDVEVPAGGCSLHDPYLLHGSPPNRSPTRRCGITIKYVATSVRLDRGFVSPTGFDWRGLRLFHARGSRGSLDYVN